jgi:lysozyme
VEGYTAFPIGGVPGIDVSHYQEVVDWSTAAAGGEVFAFAKASEGGSVADVYFADNWSAIRAAGMIRGAYHFFHPATDASAQARCFLDRLANANGNSTQLAPGDLPVALDIEVSDGVSAADIIAGVGAWLIAVEQATGRRPIVYTYVDFWKNTLGNPRDLSGYPLWISHLNVTAPTVPGGWANWIFWQFSKQIINGVSNGVVDVDAFNGTVSDLRMLAGYSSLDLHSSTKAASGKPQTTGPKGRRRKSRFKS